MTCQQPLNILGYPFLVRSNSTALLALARLSQQRFSQCERLPGKRLATLDLLLLSEPHEDGLSPLQFENQFKTVASGPRGIIQLGRWGSIFADWKRHSAFGFISSALLAHPALASRHALDTFILVSLLRRRLGVLHASALAASERVILLAGAHGTGKSTTALHLLRAGYRLVSDTLVFVRIVDEQIQLLGYGVGELKLTPDSQSLFPDLPLQTADLSIDGRRKPIFNLREQMPAYVESAALMPREIALCLVRRSADGQTRLQPLDPANALRQMLSSTSYLDEPHVMAQNLAVIDRLIQRARIFALELGSEPSTIVAALNSLWG
ncbi:MAG: hypothetical protein E6J26_05100 [Chloroflexi bacterium]|nr:MAG: hypothetical protein E6J26_05100 [Chloroflexota bacterium]